MMDSKHSPAFPQTVEDFHYFGMSLRDYFAAKARQGMIAAEHAGAFAPGRWASKAYEIADAMLNAREQ